MAEYIGNRIVPKHSGIWNSAKSYEPLIIVYEEGTGDSYISRKDVPAGTALSEEDYWALCARFSEQMELYQEDVDAAVALTNSNKNTLNSRMDTLESRLDVNVAASTDADADYAAEVVDARVNNDGEVFDSLGGAVRAVETKADTLYIEYDIKDFPGVVGGWYGSGKLGGSKKVSTFFIPVSPCTIKVTYASRDDYVFKLRFTFFDNTLDYISASGNYAATTSVTVPSTAAYMSISVYIGDSGSEEYAVKDVIERDDIVLTIPSSIIAAYWDEILRRGASSELLGSAKLIRATISTDGLAYNSSTRVITYFPLYINGKIQITLPDDMRYAYYEALSFGNVGNSGWKTGEILSLSAGLYLFNFSYTDNREITADDVYDNISFEPITQELSSDDITEIAEEAIYALTNNNIKVVNHRGYNSVAPENTLPAYILSKQKGYEYVECDVCCTSDDYVVLLHDSTIDRTSDGSGNVSDLTLEELLTYDFGSWKSDDYAGTTIPTLEEFMHLCKYLGLKPYVELKQDVSTESQVEKIVNIVKSYGMIENTTFISFSSTLLTYAKSISSASRLGYLVNSITESAVNTALGLESGENEVFIDSEYGGIDDISLAIDAGIPVEIWTIDSASAVIALDPYVSGYTTNSLDVKQKFYDQYISD